VSKLPITKDQEAEAVAIVWNMGCHSLDPDSYTELERILPILCDTRSISREFLAGQHIFLSGKTAHASDCSTSNSPAYVPGPCDCDVEA
jgi:hypothetical protein